MILSEDLSEVDILVESIIITYKDTLFSTYSVSDYSVPDTMLGSRFSVA